MTDFINPMGRVTTVRAVCAHNVSDVARVDDTFSFMKLMNIGDVVIAVSGLLEADRDNGHFLAFIFNEGRENEFALIADYDKKVKVVWSFGPDNDFAAGNLAFEHKVESHKWASLAATYLATGVVPEFVNDNAIFENDAKLDDRSLIDVLNDIFANAEKGSGIQIVGFDENGPFEL